MTTLPTRKECIENLIPSRPAEDEFRCPICMLSWDEEDLEVVATVCNHRFHKDCLLSWLLTDSASHNTCPACRRELFQSDYAMDRFDDGLFDGGILDVDIFAPIEDVMPEERAFIYAHVLHNIPIVAGTLNYLQDFTGVDIQNARNVNTFAEALSSYLNRRTIEYRALEWERWNMRLLSDPMLTFCWTTRFIQNLTQIFPHTSPNPLPFEVFGALINERSRRHDTLESLVRDTVSVEYLDESEPNRMRLFFLVTKHLITSFINVSLLSPSENLELETLEYEKTGLVLEYTETLRNLFRRDDAPEGISLHSIQDDGIELAPRSHIQAPRRPGTALHDGSALAHDTRELLLGIEEFRVDFLGWFQINMREQIAGAIRDVRVNRFNHTIHIKHMAGLEFATTEIKFHYSTIPGPQYDPMHYLLSLALW